MKGDPNVSPFTTPGTRLTWGTAGEWLAHATAIEARRHSRARYAAAAAHLEELARRLDFLDAQPAEELLACLAFVRKYHRPSKGSRAGTPYAVLVVELHNAADRAEKFAILQRGKV